MKWSARTSVPLPLARLCKRLADAVDDLCFIGHAPAVEGGVNKRQVVMTAEVVGAKVTKATGNPVLLRRPIRFLFTPALYWEQLCPSVRFTSIPHKHVCHHGRRKLRPQPMGT